MKEQLEKYLEEKENDINSFIWKGKKSASVKGQERTQTSVRMVDCSVDELKGFLNHCETMLYNSDKDNPGRYIVLDMIAEQREKCNAELFLRWLENNNDTPRYTLLIHLNELLTKNPDIDPKQVAIGTVVGGCPVEFCNITISMIMEGCIDSLGVFDRKHMTPSFVIKQGIWFSPEEFRELNKQEVKDKLEYAKKELNLSSENLSNLLYINPKGLTLVQMKSMMSLRNKKYSELGTIQLETLRNRLLFKLESEVKLHIHQWENRIRQIKLVLKSKGVVIK